MARPLRIEFPGAVYHVTSRGNARRKIFLDDEDREGFLATLSRDGVGSRPAPQAHRLAPSISTNRSLDEAVLAMPGQRSKRCRGEDYSAPGHRTNASSAPS